MSAWAAAAAVLLLAAWARPEAAGRRGTPVAARPGTARRGRQRPTAEQWAALLDSASAEVRTGSSLHAAVQRTLARHQPHGSAVHTTTTVAALTGAAVPAGDTDEAVVVQAICAAHALGGPVAATLDAASAVLRERAVIRSEALAHSAQARLSARVLTGVPLAFAAWSACTSPTFRTALLSPVGLVSAVFGGLCNLLGWWWMRRIVARAAA